MIKHDLAQYLVNMHILMEAQRQVRLDSSEWLRTEYNLAWDEFKGELKENPDARKSGQDERDINKTGADHARDQSRRSIPDWRDPS